MRRPSLLLPPLALVVLCSSTALADNEMSFELGYLRNRVAVTDNTALDGQAVRFTMKLSRGRFFHVGVEAEEGLLEGTTRLPNGNVARLAPDAVSETSTPQGPESPLEGNTLSLKLLAGVHTNIGPVMLSSDVAGGFRDTWVSSDAGIDVAGRKNAPLLELRTRADFRMTQRSSLGVVATSDLIDRRDMSLGLVFGLHFSR